MQLARVIGSIVSTRKSERLEGLKLLVAVPIDMDTMLEKGSPFVTVDTVGAGDGYAAGFLSGYLDKLPLFDCAKRANAVGAMATLVKGDMEGFPYRDQVEIFMGLKDNIDR